MDSIKDDCKGSCRHRRRGTVAVAVIVMLMIINLIVLSMTINQAHDHDLTIRRLETVQALYAAEAGVNMAVRELMEDADEDVDGTIGTISDDTDDGTDPTLGNAAFVVVAVADTPFVGQTTLTSQGRSGEARRQMSTVIE